MKAIAVWIFLIGLAVVTTSFALHKTGDQDIEKIVIIAANFQLEGAELNALLCNEKKQHEKYDNVEIFSGKDFFYEFTTDDGIHHWSLNKKALTNPGKIATHRLEPYNKTDIYKLLKSCNSLINKSTSDITVNKKTQTQDCCMHVAKTMCRSSCRLCGLGTCLTGCILGFTVHGLYIPFLSTAAACFCCLSCAFEDVNENNFVRPDFEYVIKQNQEILNNYENFKLRIAKLPIASLFLPSSHLFNKFSDLSFVFKESQHYGTFN